VVYWGKLIVNQEDVPVPAEAATGGNIVQLASGEDHVLALTKAGKVLAWAGASPVGQANALAPKETASAITAGYYHSAALLTADKGVVCWGGSADVLQAKQVCKSPPLAGQKITGISSYLDTIVAKAADGRHFLWAVRAGVDGSKDYHVLSQPAGISRIAHTPTPTGLLVWDGKGKLAQRTDPYFLPWSLQLPPAGISVVAMCSSGNTFAAALTNDGRVTV
jgi:hypothetical protein